MLRLFVITGGCLALILAFGPPSFGAGTAREIASLAGRPPLRVVVSPVNRGARRNNITDAKVANLVAARLEFGGIKVRRRGFPALLVTCRCFGRVCFASLEVVQPVSLRRRPRLKTLATTWMIEGSFQADRMTDGIGRLIARLVADYGRAK